MTDEQQVMHAPPSPPTPPSGPTTQAPPPEPPAAGPTGRYTAGIVLIVIGSLFLAGQFIPGLAWWTLWPLVIIIAGLVQAFTPGRDGWSVARMFDGFVTVAFGGVFFAITSGVVGWGVWGRILQFWPVLLISLGLEILAKSLRVSWPKVIGSLLVIGALVFSVVTYAGGASAAGWWFNATSDTGAAFSYSEPVSGVEEAQLTLDAGVARVRMGSGDNLVAVKGRSPFGAPQVDVNRAAEPAEVGVRLGGSDRAMVWPGGQAADFDIWVSDKVLWDMRINTGVSVLDADLSDVPLSSLDLRPGVAECDVRLGDAPAGADEARADVRAGISAVRLELPDGAEARIEISSGLSGRTVSGDFESLGGGIWETPGYEDARQAGRPVWLVAVKSGIGSITIDTY
ncbi:MAG: DUF5668 domain-containing protein [Coriobacteriia bacterium]|nr:DUF5668 domain-containing protein [Coriobacteriia bacterium]